MNRIYKYQLAITDVQNVPMPYGAKLLTAQWQGNNLAVWAEVDDQLAEDHTRQFLIFGTGNPADRPMKSVYIATVQAPSGLVWHVFDNGY